MRFYKIQVEGGPTFTSTANGANDPGALDVEFEVHLTEDQSDRGSHIKIKGIHPKLISRAFDFNQKNLKMWAGYSPGLPIANAQVPHQGLILDGMIAPCFGNWIFNELSLEFFVVGAPTSGLGGPTDPKNIVHNMQPGQPLSEALQNTLKTAFPTANIAINISDKLKLNYPDYGIYQSLEQLGNYVKALSHSILGNNPKYRGVTLTANGKNIYAYDGTKPGQPIQINFIDLVGQPTWIAKQTIQFMTLLRGDVNVPSNNQIIMPKTPIAQSYDSALVEKGNLLNFQGTWKVTDVRHVGQFRNPSYEAWVTIIEATQGGGGDSGSPEGAPNQSGEQTYIPPPNAPNQGTPSLGGAFGSPITNISGEQTFTSSGAAPGSSGGIGRQ